LRKDLENIKMPEAPAAILFDSDVEKAYLRHGYGHSIKFDEMIAKVFEQLHGRNIPAMFVSPESPLDGYKLLVLPSQMITRKGLALRIRAFVEAGGTVWAIGALNTADENANFTLNECPEYLTDVFGITIHTGAPIPSGDGTVQLQVTGSVPGESLNWLFDDCWIADVEKHGGAETLQSFSNGYYGGQDAVIYNQYGKGHAYYQGISNPGPELFAKISQAVIDKAKISYFRDCPVEVEIIDCGAAVFVINNNNHAVSFKYPLKGKALLGRFDAGTGLVELAAMDLCIIKKAPAEA